MKSNFVSSRPSPLVSGRLQSFLVAGALAVVVPGLAGCRHAEPSQGQKPTATAALASTNQPAATVTASTNKPVATAKRFNYTPRPYPVDERGFSPVDKALAKAYAREDLVADDSEGALNPYVLKVIAAYPIDGSYPYHCSWTPREYDIYNGVTQDLWYRGMVVAKAYPDGSRCSYCCGFTFEAFVRAMKLRNIQKGLDVDDFNGMTFGDLFNMLQFWYIEGDGDSEKRGILPTAWAAPSPTWNRRGPATSSATAPRLPGAIRSYSLTGCATRKTRSSASSTSPPTSRAPTASVTARAEFSDSNANGRGILRPSLRIARVGAIKDYKPFDRAAIPQRNAYAPTQPERIIYLPAPAAASPAASGK